MWHVPHSYKNDGCEVDKYWLLSTLASPQEPKIALHFVEVNHPFSEGFTKFGRGIWEIGQTSSRAARPEDWDLWFAGK